MAKPLGDAALRLELPADADRAACLARLRGAPGVVDVVIADRHAMVRFRPGAPPPAGLERLLGSSGGDPGAPAPARHTVAVRYDGPDLDEVATLLDLSRDEVIARHAGREYVVERIGFLPGFAYLGPVDELLARVPRRPSPRARVPPLAVGLAAGRTGVYPFASPGGWHLLGTAVGFAPFDPALGAKLRLGDLVRFVRHDR